MNGMWLLVLPFQVSFGHIKKYHPGFDYKKFPAQASQIYLEFLDAHEKVGCGGGGNSSSSS